METIEKSSEVIQDLIEINNDRIKGFETATKDLGEGNQDLKNIFNEMTAQSRQNVQELSQSANTGGNENDSSTSGAIHRAWIEVKATFTGHSRESILAECERGEDAIKKAYKEALSPNSGLSNEQEHMIAKQQEVIIASHDKIKFLRDHQA